MTVVVSGATLIAIPNPSTAIPGKKVRQVFAADTGQCQQRESARSDDWPHRERQLGAGALDQTAGPARKREHDADERQQRCARRRGGITLHLNEVEREKVQPSAERCIQEQREQVGAGEITRAKQ
jgi:hypothetical protein